MLLHKRRVMEAMCEGEDKAPSCTECRRCLVMEVPVRASANRNPDLLLRIMLMLHFWSWLLTKFVCSVYGPLPVACDVMTLLTSVVITTYAIWSLQLRPDAVLTALS